MANNLPGNIIPSGVIPGTGSDVGSNAAGGAASAAGGAGGDPTVTAIATAATELFKLIDTALQPGIMSARAYFDQLLQSRPSFQNPFAGANESRKNTNTILIYAGVGIVLMLIVAIIFKSRNK